MTSDRDIIPRIKQNHTPRFLRSPTTNTARCLHSSTLPTTASPPPSSQILTTRKLLLPGPTIATDLAKSFLHRKEPHLNSLLYISPEESLLKQAEELDYKMRNNEEMGPLAGVFVVVEDNICTSDTPSTAARLLEGYRPPFDATAVRKLRECGAIVVGKTKLDEFGMGPPRPLLIM